MRTNLISPTIDLVSGRVAVAEETSGSRVWVYRTDTSLEYRSERVPGRIVAPTAVVTDQGLAGWTMSVHHSYARETQVKRRS